MNKWVSLLKESNGLLETILDAQRADLDLAASIALIRASLYTTLLSADVMKVPLGDK
jgi:hypothetical protein